MQIILLLLSFFSTKTYIIDAQTNYLKSNIIINKTDINNDGIASATFNLYKDNKIINTYKTDDNGRIILSLDNGKYTLKETTKTTWFKLEKINLNVENKDLTINFKSKRIKPCGIRIINFDDNESIITNSIFKIYKNKEEIGENNTGGLLPGTYKIKQSYVDDSFLLNKKEYKLKLKEGEIKYIIIRNKKKKFYTSFK